MIKIEITDPSNTPASELTAIANLLLAIASGATSVTPADNPAAGSPSLAELFKPAPNPAAVFGKAEAPNVAPAFAGAVTPPIAPAAPMATLPATAAPTPPAPLPAPPAPTVAVPPAAPALGVDVDKDGLPWDARIHSSGAAKIVSGHWKKKRGISDELIAQVESELRGVMAIPAAGAPFVPPAPVAWPFPQDAAALGMAPPPPVAVPGVPTPTVLGFPQLLVKITQAVTAGTLTQAAVLAACQTVGLPAMPLLATRPDLVPSVDALLFPVTA